MGLKPPESHHIRIGRNEEKVPVCRDAFDPKPRVSPWVVTARLADKLNVPRAHNVARTFLTPKTSLLRLGVARYNHHCVLTHNNFLVRK